LWKRLAEAPRLPRERVQPTGYAGTAVECLEAAVWAVLGADGAEEAILRAVSLGGEADTIGAVAGGAAGAAWGFSALPQRWLRDLHQRDWLQEIGSRLADLRHVLTYAPPGPPPFTRWAFGDGLAAGRNPLTELDARELVAAGITHVLDLREPREWDPDLGPAPRGGAVRYGAEAVDALARLGVRRLNLPIQDGGAPSPGHLTAAVGFLDAALAAGDLADGGPRVYVHCRAGRERTAAVLLAWLVATRPRSAKANDPNRSSDPLARCLTELRERVPWLNPLPWQVDAVATWMRSRPAAP
jgi:rhodanese-related sulfurtransferase